MKKCKFHDPYYLSGYYDGILDEETEKAFADHLLTCEQCSSALLNLEKDLFIMNTVKHKKIPERYMFGNTVFRLLAEGITMIRSIPKKDDFFRFEMLPVKGEDKGAVYRMEKGDMRVDVKSEGNDRFTLELEGVTGKKIQLFCNERLIEARSHVREKGILMFDLERGNYSLVFDDQDSVKFVVE